MATAGGTQPFAVSQRPQQLLRNFPAFYAHDIVLHIIPGQEVHAAVPGKNTFHLIEHHFHFILAERYRPGYGCKGVACDATCKQFSKFQGFLYFYDFNLYTRFLFPPSVETVPSSTISLRIRLALASFTPRIDAISAHFADA